jgi:hypothetical protein
MANRQFCGFYCHFRGGGGGRLEQIVDRVPGDWIRKSAHTHVPEEKVKHNEQVKLIKSFLAALEQGSGTLGGTSLSFRSSSKTFDWPREKEENPAFLVK